MLHVYLRMRQRENAFALLTTSEEAICRVGPLSKLAHEGIYEIKVGEEIQSAVLELNEVLGLE